MRVVWQRWHGRFKALPTDHRRIASAAASVAVFVVIARAAGALREVAIAYRFGVSGTVDAYNLAIAITTWAPLTLVSVVTMVGVPLFTRLRHADDRARDDYFRELTGAVLVVSLLCVALALAGAFLLVPALGSGLLATTLTMARDFTIGLAVIAPLMIFAGVYSAQLMASERHANSLLEAVPPAVIAVVVLAWHGTEGWHALLWGTLLGFLAQAFWLRRLATPVAPLFRWPRFSLRSSRWKDVYRAAGAMIAGSLAMNLVVFVDQYAAASLGDSAIAVLGYSNRVLTLLLGVGAVAVARAALPVLSDVHSAGDHGRSQRLSLTWSAFMLGIGTILAIVAWLIAPLGIQLLFERGAFTPSDTADVARVFRFGLLQIPFFFSGLVLVQLLASGGHFGAIAIVGAGNLGLKLLINPWLASKFGVPGIALASGLMYMFSAFAYFCVVAQLRAWARFS